MEWLNFISTELHKSFSPLFSQRAPEATKQFSRERISSRLDFVARTLGETSFLLGDTFTVADAYLFTVLRWTKHTGPDLSRWPAVQQFFERVGARPAVKLSLAEERA
jgi:glutathione S-transferase